MSEGNELLILAIIFVAALVIVWALTHVIVTLRWKGRTLQALSEKKVEEALRKQQAESLQQQMASVRAEMTARTEEILRAREEELSRKARETFEGISGGLSRDLSAMKDAFEAGKKAQAEDAATLRERFDAAVRDLEAQSRAIGGKADRLADAMRGQAQRGSGARAGEAPRPQGL